MGKRKTSAPKRVSEEKRKCLSWNMLDETNQSSSFDIIPDDDPSVLQELKETEKDDKDENKTLENTLAFSNSELVESLNLYLENCSFYVRVLSSQQLKPGLWNGELGTFEVTILPEPCFMSPPSAGLPQCKEFWLYSEEQGRGLLYFGSCENDENTPQKSGQKPEKSGPIHFWVVKILFPVECLEALRCHVFRVVLKTFTPATMTLTLSIVALETSLSSLSIPCLTDRPKKQHTAMMTLMSHFFGLSQNTYEGLTYKKKHDIDELYEVIKCRHEQEERVASLELQHPALRPLLRPYQKNAVTWMVEREKQAFEDNRKSDRRIHMLYTEVTLPDGQTLYYNRHGGFVLKDRPESAQTASGGILADEMGLGKTVEVLACMLLHPRAEIARPEPLPVLEQPDPTVEQKLKSRKKKKTKKDLSNICQKVQSLDGSTQSEKTGLEVSGDDANVVSSDDKGGKSGEERISAVGSEIESQTKMGSLNSCQENWSGQDVIKPQLQETENQSKEFIPKTVNQSVGDSGSVTSQDRIKNAESVCKDDTDLDNPDNPITTECSANGSKNKKQKSKKAAAESEIVDDAAYFKNIFTEKPADQRSCFECICGAVKPAETKKDKKKHPVQCVKCSLWQHAECVNFDLWDPYRGEFKCPHCAISSPPVPSGATLIISPSSICHQWLEEIQKHVERESLKVYGIEDENCFSLDAERTIITKMYTGVNKQGFIQPRTLAKHDIVIVTYETLRKELDYVDLPHNNSATGRKLRHPKRFMAIPSPITAVEWWRICLDEAQMVECTTTKTAEMALRLTGVNRWCVTGTPIQKGIQDLYGLLLFLGVDPYWVQLWWNKLVYEPFCYGLHDPLHDLLTSVLWRTAKKDVLDQIRIPEQGEEIHWLTFSPVEEHFYRQQYRDCARVSRQLLSKWTDSSLRLSNIDRHTVSKLLTPLLRLRQACCHPQVVRGEFLPLHKTTMTMEELLESMTKKARLEAVDSHRQLVASMNGQAGLYIIQGEPLSAVEQYREVLQSIEEHKEQLDTDSLQQLHTMYNLHEIISSKPAGLQPTLRDDQLPKQIMELKDKYLSKAIAYVDSTEEALRVVQEDVNNLQQQMGGDFEWWVGIISWTVDRDQDVILVQRVRDDLLENRNPEVTSIVGSIRTTAGMEYVIHTHLMALDSAYEKLQRAMKGLSKKKPSQELINKTVECCLRPVGEILKTCPFCKCEELFEAYESKLFSFSERGLIVDNTGGEGPSHQVNTRRQGTWASSEVEIALRSILGFARMYRGDAELVDSGSVHLKLFDAWKKEYKRMRTYWAGLKEHVSTFDELDMATTRLRLRLEDEPEPETPQPNILEPSQLTHHKLKLASDRIVAHNELRKKLGQLIYLKNLAKSQAENLDGENPDPCPICQTELGKEWSVLQCGHCFCMECIRIVVDRGSFGGHNRSLRCAVCRQTSHKGEISYVMTNQQKHSADDEEYIRVKGSHSSKVEAVVRCLLKINRDDPHAKSLVFSTWTDVLSVVASALTENNIEYKALYASGKFQHNLSAFKLQDDVKVLLLPVHSGANGLNLVEATNVLLVEPILNPAQELQAIGRVHRIGQTRATKVHRFLIRATIEQKMHTLLKSMAIKATARDAEENALTIGDLSSLFTQHSQSEDGDVDPVGGETGNGGQGPVMTVDSSSSMQSTSRSEARCSTVNSRACGSEAVPGPSSAKLISDGSRSPVVSGSAVDEQADVQVVSFSNSADKLLGQSSFSSGASTSGDSSTKVQTGSQIRIEKESGPDVSSDLTMTPDVIVVEEDPIDCEVDQDAIIVEDCATVVVGDDDKVENTVGELHTLPDDVEIKIQTISDAEDMDGETGSEVISVYSDVESLMEEEEEEEECISENDWEILDEDEDEDLEEEEEKPDEDDCMFLDPELIEDDIEIYPPNNIQRSSADEKTECPVIVEDSETEDDTVVCTAVDLTQEVMVLTGPSEEALNVPAEEKQENSAGDNEVVETSVEIISVGEETVIEMDESPVIVSEQKGIGIIDTPSVCARHLDSGPSVQEAENKS